jgi:hypothetical protein
LGEVELGTFGRTTWKSGVSEGESLFATAVDNGTPRPDILVLVDVLDRGAGVWNCWVGDGVSNPLEGSEFFQGAVQVGAILEERKTSGNFVVRYVLFRVSNSLSKGRPSSSETRPVKSPSTNTSSRNRAYSSVEAQPRKSW